MVYRLAVDAMPKADDVAVRKYLSLLKDFHTDTASMARRDIAATTRGGFRFLFVEQGYFLAVSHSISGSFSAAQTEIIAK